MTSPGHTVSGAGQRKRIRACGGQEGEEDEDGDMARGMRLMEGGGELVVGEELRWTVLMLLTYCQRMCEGQGRGIPWSECVPWEKDVRGTHRDGGSHGVGATSPGKGSLTSELIRLQSEAISRSVFGVC